jgi:hypothetical protein
MLLGKVFLCLQKTETRFMLVTQQVSTQNGVQERTGNTPEAIGRGKDFLSRTQVVQRLRESINKWDYMKLKRFCTTKEMVS